jgi:hypothetical protein
MTIELSYVIFTDEDDIVPASGEDKILNTGIANTLAGNDVITGTGEYGVITGTFEYGNNVTTLNTGDGNDEITGTTTMYPQYNPRSRLEHGMYGIIIGYGSTLDTGKGDDIITGSAKTPDDITGISMGFINLGTFNTDDGNDTITGIADNSNDTLIGGVIRGLHNSIGSTFDTGKGNDVIMSSGEYSFSNNGTFNTDDDNDTIICQGGFLNSGTIFLGDGNDSIIVTSFFERYFDYYNTLDNSGFIDTGNGDDIITSTTPILNGIYNTGGAINMGDGNDSIIANEGFESGPNSSGAWFLGEGDDYIKGYGSGDFYGGNGNDTLELTPGTYTVGIWGEGGESPIFTKGDQLMITSEFEKLKAGSTIYDFTSLTAGQIIIVA